MRIVLLHRSSHSCCDDSWESGLVRLHEAKPGCSFWKEADLFQCQQMNADWGRLRTLCQREDELLALFSVWPSQVWECNSDSFSTHKRSQFNLLGELEHDAGVSDKTAATGFIKILQTSCGFKCIIVTLCACVIVGKTLTNKMFIFVKHWDILAALKTYVIKTCLLSNIQIQVNTVSLNPAGTLLVSGCKDGAVTIWDHSSQRTLQQIHCHSGTIHQTDFSPGLCERGTLNFMFNILGDQICSWKLWVNNSLKLNVWLSTVKVHVESTSSAFFEAAVGCLILLCESNNPLLLSRKNFCWEITTPRLICIIQRHVCDYTTFAFSDSRHVLSVGADSCMKVIDVQTGMVISSVKAEEEQRFS